MTIGRLINVASVLFGAAGATVLFVWTPVFGGFPGWGSRNGNWMGEKRKQNQRRQTIQRVGFALVLLSLFLQGVALFVDP
jgi:hypothetical protein